MRSPLAPFNAHVLARTRALWADCGCLVLGCGRLIGSESVPGHSAPESSAAEHSDTARERAFRRRSTTLAAVEDGAQKHVVGWRAVGAWMARTPTTAHVRQNTNRRSEDVLNGAEPPKTAEL